MVQRRNPPAQVGIRPPLWLTTQTSSRVGSLSAVGGNDVEAVVLTDRRTGNKRSLPVRRASGTTYVWLAPDGGQLAAINQLEMRIWDTRRDAAPIVIAQPPAIEGMASLAISADGSRLALGTRDVRIYDLRAAGTAPLLLKGLQTRMAFTSLAYSPDGALLAGGTTSGSTEVWDLRDPTASPVSLPGRGGVASLVFSPDHHYLASSTAIGGVYVWSLGAAAADYICTRVWRNLSMDEWRLHVGENIPYQRTCPALPAGVGAR